MDAIGVGRAQFESELRVLVRNGGAIVLSAEAIGAGNDPAEFFGIEEMALEHLTNRDGMAFGQPEALGVFVDNVEVAVAVFAAEQEDCVMGVAVVKGCEPFDSP